MAQLVGVFTAGHTPFCYLLPERWNEARTQRAIRADVPRDDYWLNAAGNKIRQEHNDVIVKGKP